jgi:transient receptor potential cation channel subfamily A protein 1
MNNLIEWILYLSAAGFVVPTLWGIQLHVQWESGAVAVFLAWFNLLLFLQR